MLIVMGVTLYTSRVILEALGIEDFGIYNVVGGLVAMFSFFTSSLANATQRYLSFEIGGNNIAGIQKVFSLSILIYFIISLIVIFLAETVGLYFVKEKLVIPIDRMNAAIWVFQTTVLSLFFTINGVVFTSVLIARENMKVFAYIGLLEAFLKLGIAFFISSSPFDKLKSYAVLILLSTILIQLLSLIICKIKYEECKMSFSFDKKLFSSMFRFVGWNGFGTAVWAINDYGISILLNMFFGPVVNAAKGISSQVNSAVNNLSMNIFTAVRPQVVKSYANNDLEYFIKMLFLSSRYSFFLMLTLAIPLIYKANYVLNLWLELVPPDTSLFVVWVLIYSLVNVLTVPFWSSMLAIGDLRKYTLIGGGVFLLAFPISCLALYLGAQALAVFKILAFMRLVYLFVSFKILSTYINVSFRTYAMEVLSPILKVSIISAILGFILDCFFNTSLIGFLLFITVFIIFQLGVIYGIGLNNRERLYVKLKLKCLRKYY